MEIKRSNRPRVEKPEPEPVPESPPQPLPKPRRSASSVWLGISVIMLLFAVTVCVIILKGPSIDPTGSASPLALYPMPFEAPEVDNTGRVIKSEAGEVQGYAEAVTGAEPIEMVQLSGGDFNMGVPELEPEAEPEEGPPHTVKLSPFFIGRREITQEQWKAVSHLPQVKTPLVEEPSESRGDQLPVDSVSWEDCQEFCRRLSRLSKRKYRLPTEAEWEYAARAGTGTPFCFGPTISPEVAVYNATQAYGESPVQSEPRLSAANVGDTGAANRFGMFDVHGNVEEWCQDWYGPYNPKTSVNPIGPEKGTERVLRGGGWYSYAWNCRSASRAHARPEQGSNYTGFRIVCEPEHKK
jgi:formylglycine-generating enzyme required for sulfatase activity